jgi:hypothetical protein
LKSFDDESHLEMLCPPHLLDLTALWIPKVLHTPGLFLLPLLDPVVKFDPVFVFIGQSATLPESLCQMAIKDQVAFWIAIDVKTALDPNIF